MRRLAWYGITALGNAPLLAASALLIAAAMFLTVSTRRLSVAWLVVVMTGAAVVAATKVLYMGWGLGIASLDFTGLSGHTTLSVLVWPVALSLLAGQTDTRMRVGAAGGFLLASGIAVSRLEVHAHSAAEVILGGAFGLVLSGAFLLRHLRRLRDIVFPRWIAITLIIPFAIGFGHALPTESVLAEVARTLSGHSRAYTRADLHSADLPRSAGQETDRR